MVVIVPGGRVASAAAPLVASTKLGRQFLSDRVFLWEPDYPRFPTPVAFPSHSPCPFIPFVTARPGHPATHLPVAPFLPCWSPRDVSERRGPIGARTELWSETGVGERRCATQTGAAGTSVCEGVASVGEDERCRLDYATLDSGQRATPRRRRRRRCTRLSSLRYFVRGRAELRMLCLSPRARERANERGRIRAQACRELDPRSIGVALTAGLVRGKRSRVARKNDAPPPRSILF